MKFYRTLLPFLAVLAAVVPESLYGAPTKEPDPAQLTIAVASVFEQLHYSKQRLDKALSRKVLRNYLDSLDHNHLFFTKEDVDGFTAKWGEALDSEIIFGRLDAAREIHNVYRARVEEYVAFAKGVLAEESKLDGDHSIEVNRQKAPWPAAGEEARRLWRDRLDSELIQERLAKKKKAEPAAAIIKRYDQFLKGIREQKSEDVVNLFLLSIARTYDPHSDYLGKSDQEQFNISMRLSLFGIGARLRSEDGFTKVEQLVAGGPASKSGKIKAGDRIVAVAQGNAEFVDCVDMALDKVILMIRGDKDTVVRLQLMPVGSTNPSELNVVELVRDEIKLKDGEAHAELIEWRVPDGDVLKIGYIELPSFYRDMTQNGNNPEAKSTTRDVLVLLNRLKAEGIDGLVMDFRRDGGGSLEEAINLSGLFFKDGPVVQIKNWNGEITVSKDTDPSIAYDGPMVVLVNRQSASASEIFAAAMQDYGRAVIVGDSKTFGKGTVQQLLELNRVVPLLSKEPRAGAVKLTIQKFYRVAGGSTQLRGVESDILLPSTSDQPEIGEDGLKDPLPYDTIRALDIEKWGKPLHLEQLRTRAEQRVALNPEFGYVVEDLGKVRKYLDDNRLSINEGVRMAEVEADKALREKREAERAKVEKALAPKAFRITLDNARAKDLLPITFVEPKSTKEGEPAEETPAPKDEKEDAKEFKTAPLRYDPVKEEGLNILGDLVRLLAEKGGGR
jgi:carboxyl-terminal processing protease